MSEDEFLHRLCEVASNHSGKERQFKHARACAHAARNDKESFRILGERLDSHREVED